MKRRPLLFLAVMVLLAVSFVMIASSSAVWAELKYNDAYYYVKRQLIFAVIGWFAFLFASRFRLELLHRYRKLILFSCYLALLLVLIPGLGVQRNGSRSWFGVGAFLLQPSEFFKLALILEVSAYLSQQKRMRKLRDLLYPLLLAGTGFALIMLQPDFGSGIVMISSIAVLLLTAAAPLRYFIGLGVLGIAGLAALIISAPYRLARILSFLDPWSDPLGSGFQIIQSLFAIAPGGLLGMGLRNSIQKHFYLPEPQTDFIFAIICEELGFIGALLVILAYLILFKEAIDIVLHCKNSYWSYVSMGVISLFSIQVMINLGVVVGLFPVTGITLPLLSYGGSSLVMMMASLGLLVNISQNG